MAGNGKGDGKPVSPDKADDKASGTHGFIKKMEKMFNIFKPNPPALDETDSPRPFAQEEFDSEEYDFNHNQRGKAVIIYNCEFADGMIANLNQDHMAKDVKCLKQVLSDKLGFEVDECWNLTATDMLKKLEDVSKEDHTHNDCFFCVISSHGFWRPMCLPDDTIMLGDHVFGTDAPLTIYPLLDKLSAKNCPGLAGKPKIFLFEACRGGLFTGKVRVKETTGIVVEAAAASHPVNPVDLSCKERSYNEGLPYHVPVLKDIFLAYATTPDFVSYLDDVGAPFIQSVCDHLDKEGHSTDFATLMDHAQADVARGYESNNIKTDTGTYSKQKQMPWVASMWTKDVYFRPKE